MKKLILGLMILGGCTSLDVEVQKNLPQICAAGKQAYEVWSATESGSEKTRRRVEVAYASLTSVCENPSETTAASVVTTAFLAYVTISKEIK